HGTRPPPLPEARRAPRRPALGRERGRPWQHLPPHPPRRPERAGLSPAELAATMAWASVRSSDVNCPSWRLHTQRPPHAPLVTTRTTKHLALIPHEVSAGARR